MLSTVRYSNHYNNDCSIRVFDCNIREYQSFLMCKASISPTLKTPLYLQKSAIVELPAMISVPILMY